MLDRYLDSLWEMCSEVDGEIWRIGLVLVNCLPCASWKENKNDSISKLRRLYELVVLFDAQWPIIRACPFYSVEGEEHRVLLSRIEEYNRATAPFSRVAADLAWFVLRSKLRRRMAHNDWSDCGVCSEEKRQALGRLLVLREKRESLVESVLRVVRRALLDGYSETKTVSLLLNNCVSAPYVLSFLMPGYKIPHSVVEEWRMEGRVVIQHVVADYMRVVLRRVVRRCAEEVRSDATRYVAEL